MRLQRNAAWGMRPRRASHAPICCCARSLRWACRATCFGQLLRCASLRGIEPCRRCAACLFWRSAARCSAHCLTPGLASRSLLQWLRCSAAGAVAWPGATARDPQHALNAPRRLHAAARSLAQPRRTQPRRTQPRRTQPRVMGYAREIFVYGAPGDLIGLTCALCYDVLKDAQQCMFGHRRAAVATARG